MERLAYHDAMTGLPNRPLYIDRLILALAQASRSNQRLAVFFLDLDRFKDINDSLGHSIGDSLLKAVAERIRRCVREGDTVARFGGDEFTLLIPRIEQVEDAAKIAQKILEIAENSSWQLRHPVGPDAVPFLQWRGRMTDEEWVDLNASDDETWYRSLERDFGMDTRPKK